MGSSIKRLKKARVRYSDSEEPSDLENEKLTVRSESDVSEYYDCNDELDCEEGETEEDEESEEEDEEEMEVEEDDQEEGTGEEEEESGDEPEDDKKDVEMEELEKEYMDLRRQEQDILKNLKQNKDEDALKGQAVKNQKALWDKTLEFRFLLHKPFSSSNRLPQEPIKSSFCSGDETISSAHSDLITSSKKTLNSLLELQEALLEKNPSINHQIDGQATLKHSVSNDPDAEEDCEWSRVSSMHKRISAFRDKAVDKWQRRTQVTTGAAAFKGKLHAFNQNVSEQVASHMRDPSRMVKQMQQRSTVSVFGAVPEDVAQTKQEVDGDPEILDDTEFYQQLLKEFFESIDPASSETAFYALKKMQTKKRKVVDRRASKSRKIRYNIHEKIVNFMAPQPIKLPPMANDLLKDLFGLRTQNLVPGSQS